MSWNPTLGPLREQYNLSTAEPLLQPPTSKEENELSEHMSCWRFGKRRKATGTVVQSLKGKAVMPARLRRKCLLIPRSPWGAHVTCLNLTCQPTNLGSIKTTTVSPIGTHKSYFLSLTGRCCVTDRPTHRCCHSACIDCPPQQTQGFLAILQVSKQSEI